MASHKLNLAFVRNCPALITVKAALDTVGRPTDKDHGVLAVHEIDSEGKLEFAIFRTKEVKLRKVRKEDGAVEKPTVYKDDLFEAAIRRCPEPNAEGLATLEVYSGSVKSIDTLAEFLSVLELGEEPLDVSHIPLDIVSVLTELRDDARTRLFQVLSCKIKGYQDREEDCARGDFTVRFGKDANANLAMCFVADHADRVVQVKIKYRRDPMRKPVTLTVRPTAFFNISCTPKDEKVAKDMVREIAGAKHDPPAGAGADGEQAAAEGQAS